MSRKPDLQVPTQRLPPERAESVRAGLEHVLGSPLFRGSRRCHNLLRRIADQSIAGGIDSLKERALGVDVFGRPADYNTSGDPVVRASARDLDFLKRISSQSGLAIVAGCGLLYAALLSAGDCHRS